MSNRATRRALLRAVGLALLAPGRVLAQVTYPNRPVRILVPFAPGGGSKHSGSRSSSRTARVLLGGSAPAWWRKRKPTAIRC